MTTEYARALLEDYAFMLKTGESPATAATRFGCSLNTLEKRVDRARKVVRENVSLGRKRPAVSVRIGSTTTTTPAARQRCYPGPNHREGVAS